MTPCHPLKKARTLQKEIRNIRKRCQLNSSFRDCNKNKKDKHSLSVVIQMPQYQPPQERYLSSLTLNPCEGERKDVKSACLAFLTRNKCAVS